MQSNRNRNPHKIIRGSSQTPGVDTSFLYEELRRQYIAAGAPIEADFRGLVNWMKVGDQRTHQLHPYPAKLLPHIAHFFVHASSLSKASSLVLDPFCGSGTVALEASMAGRQALAADANPMARLLTRVKTTPYNTEKLLKESVKIIARAKRYKTAPVASIVNERLWYSPSRKRNLEILLRAINEVEDTINREFFHVCFSVLARRLSYADPAISVPVRLKVKPQRSVVANIQIEKLLSKIENADQNEDFAEVCLTNINRIARTNLERPDRKAAQFVGEDARKLVKNEGNRLDSDCVDLVITSPPYGSAQKYVRSMSLSLNWLGLTHPDNLVEVEGKTIGREHLPSHQSVSVRPQETLDVHFETLLDRIAHIDPRRERISRTYLAELNSSIDELSRVLSVGGHAIIVIGNNTVCGTILPTDKFVINSMRTRNCSLELHVTDKIKSRGLLTKRNGGASAISREHVLVFRKAASCQ